VRGVCPFNYHTERSPHLSDETLAPTTELEAVNDMLSVISEAPVAQLDEVLGDAQLALRLLRQENRAVQAQGWHWNTEDGLLLTPDVNGEIVLPAGTLQVDTVGASAALDYTTRSGKLYDRVNQTFKLPAAVTVDLVVALAYENLPENARQYVKVRAGRKFLQRTMGASDVLGFEAKDETHALAAMQAEEESDADRSILNNPDFQRLMPGRRPNLWP
jgi:hypothetical protein